MGVDFKWNCYYNPETITKWTVQEVATVLEHEAWHLLRKHHTRTPGTGPTIKQDLSRTACHLRWNLSTDCEINDDLIKTPHNQLPERAVLPQNWKLKTEELAEWYYENIPADAVSDLQISLKGQPSPKNKPGQQPGQTEANPEEGEQPNWGGSCADGQSRPWEEGGEHLYPIDKELIQRQVAQEIKKQKGRGTIPTGQSRWADDTLKEPIVPWNKELASIMRGHFASLSGRSDSTYSRRNRRQSCYGKIIRPSFLRLLPTIAVVVDTSGSVSDEMLSQALTETHMLLKANEGSGVHVLSCDAAVHSVQKVFNRKQVAFCGAGGTDMTIGVMAALKLKPHVVVLITDGYTPYPATCPDQSVRWVTLVLSPQGNVPAYGKVVKVHAEHYA
jgi:predicted metal-dependent peptidase